jgi:heavy metal sensor kinase
MRSLRARLLVWYTAMLAVVIAAFGATVCFMAWREQVAKVDADLAESANALARALRPAGAGRFDLDLPAEYGLTSAEPARYYVIFDRAGDILDRSDPDLRLARPEAGRRTRAGRRELAIVTADAVTIVAGRDLAAARAMVWTLAGTIGAAGLAALGLALAGGWLLVGRALKPIDRISRTARAMTGGNLAARIAVDRLETELSQVAHALNDAFDRLQSLLEQERQFTADASHELRTPLTTMTAEVDWALGRERSAIDYRKSLEVCQRAAGRMRVVVERLLTLARADAGQIRLDRVPVRLDAVVHDALALVRPLADRRRLRMEVSADPVTVMGDGHRLLEAVTNVLVNAVQYNRDDGCIHVTARGGDRGAEIVVTDTGIGIAPADLPRVFQRFYRADRARASDRGGVGLGLALARWIVEAHGGRITATSTPGEGSAFSVQLPGDPVPDPGTST